MRREEKRGVTGRHDSYIIQTREAVVIDKLCYHMYYGRRRRRCARTCDRSRGGNLVSTAIQPVQRVRGRRWRKRTEKISTPWYTDVRRIIAVRYTDFQTNDSFYFFFFCASDRRIIFLCIQMRFASFLI